MPSVLNIMILYAVAILLLPMTWTLPADQNDPRIIGGVQARAGQFPFSVALTVNTPDSYSFCGGALISIQWVLTAAYCLQNATQVVITLGTILLNETNANALVLSSTETYPHPEYDSETFEHNIGLIEFRQPIQYSDYIGKIHLPVTDYGSDVYVTSIGWGQTSDAIPGPNYFLSCVQLTTISNMECEAYYAQQVLESMICALGNYNEGICTGDSGSPMVYYLNYVHPVVVGIASFHSGVGCEKIHPSGYTRVFPYRDWILNITGTIV